MKLAMCAVSMGAAAVALSSLYCLAADKPAEGKKKILFYSQSFGFRHSVVARPKSGELSHAEKILKDIGEKAGYQIDVTQDFNDMKGLKDYDAVVIYTTGNPLIDRADFLKWLRNGGAVIGIHTATDSFHHRTAGEALMNTDQKPLQPGDWAEYGRILQIPDWPEYVRIIGGAFKTHGAQAATIMKIHDPSHPATKMLEPGWTITDEIYQFDRFNKDTHLLISVDTEKMDDATLDKLKMKKGEFYPVAWTNTEGKGRVFYTSLGHREDVWTNPVYQQHVLGGMAWALGQAEAK